MGSLWIPVAELLLVWPGQLFCLLHQSQDLSHITWQGQTDWTNGYEMIRNDTNGGWTAVCRLSSSGTATWTCEVCHLTNLMNWQISNHKPWAYPEIDMKAIPLKILFKVQTCFLTSPMLWTGAGECMPVSASLLSHSHSPSVERSDEKSNTSCWRQSHLSSIIIYREIHANTTTCAQSKSFLSQEATIACGISWIHRLQLVSSFAWCSSCQSWPIFWAHLSLRKLFAKTATLTSPHLRLYIELPVYPRTDSRKTSPSFMWLIKKKT